MSYNLNGNPFRQWEPALDGTQSLKACSNLRNGVAGSWNDEKKKWKIAACSRQGRIFSRLVPLYSMPSVSGASQMSTNECGRGLLVLNAGLKSIFNAVLNRCWWPGLVPGCSRLRCFAFPACGSLRLGCASAPASALNRCHPGLTFSPALVYLRRNAPLRKA